MRSPELVVGIDDSPHSEKALAWAATEAARRQVALLVLNVYDWHDVGAPGPAAPLLAASRARAEQLAAEAVARVRDLAPEVDVRGQAAFGHVAQTIVRAAGDGATIVVGSRGRGGFASLLLGSVSQQVALHAPGPVVVVRGRPDPEGPVLVGVDGSPESDQALRLAFEEAARRGTSVTAVRAYTLASAMYAPVLAGYYENPDERRDAELAALAGEVAPWAEKYPDIQVSCSAIEGHPGDVLARRSSGACVVVVGNRGRGGFAGLLLGSVSLYVLHHADCPVIIARAAKA